MASNAISGVNAKFRRSDMQDPAVFTAIAEVNSIDGPNKSRDTIDVTSLDSTGGYREFIASFRDGGEVSLEMNYTMDGYLDLNADFELETRVDYQIELPDGVTLDFSGLVTSIGLGVPLDDKITAPISIKVSGQVVLTAP